MSRGALLTGLLYGLCGSFLAEAGYVEDERGFSLRLPVGWNRVPSASESRLSNGTHQVNIALLAGGRDERLPQASFTSREFFFDGHWARVLAWETPPRLATVVKTEERCALLLATLGPGACESELQQVLNLCLSLRFL